MSENTSTGRLQEIRRVEILARSLQQIYEATTLKWNEILTDPIFTCRLTDEQVSDLDLLGLLAILDRIEAQVNLSLGQMERLKNNPNLKNNQKKTIYFYYPSIFIFSHFTTYNNNINQFLPTAYNQPF